MKNFMIVTLLGALISGCYVPMPSVGVKPTRVYHQKVCVYVGATERLQCTHTRRYVK
jgi:hypothetical protein